MKDLLQTSREVEARLRESNRAPGHEGANVIAALITALKVAQKLSVTNIMLNVVPGDDGNGYEVYAKSVDDVVSVLSSMNEKLEDFELGIRQSEPVRTALKAAQWNYSAISSALTDAVQDKDLLREQLKAAHADAARWKMLVHMEASTAAPDTLASYIRHPDKLDYVIQLHNEHDAAIAAQSAQEKS